MEELSKEETQAIIELRHRSDPVERNVFVHDIQLPPIASPMPIPTPTPTLPSSITVSPSTEIKDPSLQPTTQAPTLVLASIAPTTATPIVISAPTAAPSILPTTSSLAGETSTTPTILTPTSPQPPPPPPPSTRSFGNFLSNPTSYEVWKQIIYYIILLLIVILLGVAIRYIVKRLKRKRSLLGDRDDDSKRYDTDRHDADDDGNDDNDNEDAGSSDDNIDVFSSHAGSTRKDEDSIRQILDSSAYPTPSMSAESDILWNSTRVGKGGSGFVSPSQLGGGGVPPTPNSRIKKPPSGMYLRPPSTPALAPPTPLLEQQEATQAKGFRSNYMSNQSRNNNNPITEANSNDSRSTRSSMIDLISE